MGFPPDPVFGEYGGVSRLRPSQLSASPRPGPVGGAPFEAVAAEGRLRAALDALYRIDPRLRAAEEAAGPPPWRSRPEGFGAMLRTIVGQQLSTVAATAIFERLAPGGAVPLPGALLAMPGESLRALGLSQQKIGYVRGLADAVATGRLDFAALRGLPDEECIGLLTGVKGIGRWTAEIYLLFALDRPDVFPSADLALQAACCDLLALPARPSAREAAVLAEAWRPHRGAAARLLWHYYGRCRNLALARRLPVG
ncbi:MAG TPA: DNA-3-methyladenine glycosylase 2 family protein [Stellaceae bacterium]